MFESLLKEWKDKVRFEKVTHTYWIGERQVDGVSRTLSKIGLKKDHNFYAKGSKERGTKLHNDMEYYDLFDTAIGRQLQKFMAQYNCEIIHRETLIYNEEFDYSGTFDAIMVRNGVLYMVDYKTGKKELWHRHQAALYSMPLKIKNMLIIYINEDGYKPWWIEGMPFDTAMREVRSALQVSRNSIAGNNK